MLVEVLEAHAVPNGRTMLNRGEVLPDELLRRFLPGPPGLVAVGDGVEFVEPSPKTSFSSCPMRSPEAAAILAPLTLGPGPIPFSPAVDRGHAGALRFRASRQATNCALSNSHAPPGPDGCHAPGILPAAAILIQ